MLHLLIRPRQPDDLRMELLQIFAQDFRRVANRIARDKHRQEEARIASRLVDLVDDLGHFVKFVWADIGAMRESEVNLTHHHVISIYPIRYMAKTK